MMDGGDILILGAAALGAYWLYKSSESASTSSQASPAVPLTPGAANQAAAASAAPASVSSDGVQSAVTSSPMIPASADGSVGFPPAWQGANGPFPGYPGITSLAELGTFVEEAGASDPAIVNNMMMPERWNAYAEQITGLTIPPSWPYDAPMLFATYWPNAELMLTHLVDLPLIPTSSGGVGDCGGSSSVPSDWMKLTAAVGLLAFAGVAL